MRKSIRMMALGASVLGTSCELPISSPGQDEVALSIVVHSSQAQFDEGRVHIRGPTDRDLVMQPGTTDTIAGLVPGTYTVALEGVVAGAVEGFGETTGIVVHAGTTTVANITMGPFLAPTLDSLRCLASAEFRVSLSAGPWTASFDVQSDLNPGFSNPSSASISATSAVIPVAQAGRRYVRARALTPYGSVGRWSATGFVNVLPEDAIAFVSSRDGNEEIYVIGGDGSALMNLTNSPDEDETSPQWSPDGSMIAFASISTGGVGSGYRIEIMDADGTHRTEANGSPLWLYQAPPRLAWSPAGDRLVFDLDPDYVGPELRDLYVLDLAEGQNARLAGSQGSDRWQPAWSPDGTRIAYVEGPTGGTSELWVMNSDGQSPQHLGGGAPQGSHQQPAWSPDGGKIAYARFDSDIWRILVMNADGSGVLNLTGPRTVSEAEPSWSPDGEKIAFSRSGDIYIMYSIDGAELRRLTTHAADDGEPAWRPVF